MLHTYTVSMVNYAILLDPCSHYWHKNTPMPNCTYTILRQHCPSTPTGTQIFVMIQWKPCRVCCGRVMPMLMRSFRIIRLAIWMFGCEWLPVETLKPIIFQQQTKLLFSCLGKVVKYKIAVISFFVTTILMVSLTRGSSIRTQHMQHCTMCCYCLMVKLAGTMICDCTSQTMRGQRGCPNSDFVLTECIHVLMNSMSYGEGVVYLSNTWLTCGLRQIKTAYSTYTPTKLNSRQCSTVVFKTQ